MPGKDNCCQVGAKQHRYTSHQPNRFRIGSGNWHFMLSAGGFLKYYVVCLFLFRISITPQLMLDGAFSSPVFSNVTRCWFDTEPTYARWVLTTVWLWLIMFALIVVYLKTSIYVWPRRKLILSRKVTLIRYEQEHYVLPPLHQILLYPVVLLFVWIPTFLNNIFHDVGTAYYAAIITPLQGFLNFLLFISTAQLDKGSDKPVLAGDSYVQVEADDSFKVSLLLDTEHN